MSSASLPPGSWSPQGAAPQRGPVGPTGGWTPRADPRLPALTSLPAPPQAPPSPPALPDQIVLESAAELSRRIRRGFWRPGLLIALLWELLTLLYVHATSPSMWLLSPLLAMDESFSMSNLARTLGFSPLGIGLALLLVPVIGTAVSLALVPLAARAAGAIDPRRLLRSTDVPDLTGRRIAGVLLAPVAGTMTLLVLAVICQLPLQWKDLSFGVLADLAIAVGLLWVAYAAVRSTVRPRVLLAPQDIAPELTVGAPVAEEHVAQDRRHLPPTGGPQPGMALRAARITATAIARWTGAAVLAIAWLVFGFADLVALFSRAGLRPQSTMHTGLPWSTWLVGALAVALLGVVLALAPAVAMRAAEGLRGSVRDLRTVDSWEARRAVNPWEARVCSLAAALDVLGAAALLALTCVVLSLTGGLDAVTITLLVLGGLIVLPLLYGGALAGMRSSLRDMVYGPAGVYMRRRTRWARVTPERGTRTQMAQDPVMRGRMDLARAQAADAAAGVDGSPAGSPLSGAVVGTGFGAIGGTTGSPLVAGSAPAAGSTAAPTLPDYGIEPDAAPARSLRRAVSREIPRDLSELGRD